MAVNPRYKFSHFHSRLLYAILSPMTTNKLRWRLGNLVSRVRYWEWKLDNKTLARLQWWLQDNDWNDDTDKEFWR